MFLRRRHRLYFWASCLPLIIAVLAVPTPVEAQALTRAQVEQRSQKASELFNWYYAAVYGTGAYKIGEETVGVIRLPMAYNIRQATDTEWGLRLTFPVSAALAEFDLTDFDLGHVSAVGVSFLPGVEAEIPLRPGWVVSPSRMWEGDGSSSATLPR